MRYGRKGKGRAAHGDGSFWICFSDLMSALMLVFILVMFYSVYQYFTMLEVKTAELLRQSGLLDEQQAQLTLSQAELAEKEAQLAEQTDQLNAQSAKLTEQETAMLAQFAGEGQERFRQLITGCSGGAVCIIVLAMAIAMIAAANRQLGKEGKTI